RESRLNALAVYALALAIAWLPGHTCVGSDLEAAAAHTSPARFTTAAHIRVPLKRPPMGPAATLPSVAAGATKFKNAVSWLAVGNPAQECRLFPSSSANTDVAHARRTAQSEMDLHNFMFDS